MKKSSTFILPVTLALLGALIPRAHSETPAPKPAETVPVPPATPTPVPPKLPKGIRYKPPGTGAATEKVTGGTRAGGGDFPVLSVLAPGHEGLTTQAQPTLFWYQSAPAKVDLNLKIIEPNKADPMLTILVGSQQKAGISAISLARQKLSLKPNVSYEWNVSFTVDPKSPSKNLVAKGVIKFVEPPADLAARVEKASEAERAGIYAESGYWYDALRSISLAIAAEPKNAALHQIRANLLDQGKLTEAAAAERKQ